MRALAQSLEERANRGRYLRLEGEHTDLCNLQRTIGWIRDEFVAAAKSEDNRDLAADAVRTRSLTLAPAHLRLAEFAASQAWATSPKPSSS